MSKVERVMTISKSFYDRAKPLKLFISPPCLFANEVYREGMSVADNEAKMRSGWNEIGDLLVSL